MALWKMRNYSVRGRWKREINNRKQEKMLEEILGKDAGKSVRKNAVKTEKKTALKNGESP